MDEFSFYIKVKILQCAPRFVSDTCIWKPATDTPEYEFAKYMTLDINYYQLTTPEDLTELVRNKLYEHFQTDNYVFIIPSSTSIYAGDFGFDDNTVQEYKWDLHHWYSTNLWFTPVDGDETHYTTKQQVINHANGANPTPTLLSTSAFTLNDSAATLPLTK